MKLGACYLGASYTDIVMSRWREANGADVFKKEKPQNSMKDFTVGGEGRVNDCWISHLDNKEAGPPCCKRERGRKTKDTGGRVGILHVEHQWPLRDSSDYLR